jgi:DNA helicase-2/ATP-dependent DNA helicase PcrA
MVDAGERADVVLERVLAASGYLKELEDSEDPQDETRVENLAELVAVAREFADEPVPPTDLTGDGTDDGTDDVDAAGDAAGDGDGEADGGAPGPGLPEFLERVALVADTDQIPDQDDESTGVVTLMTLHTAKGLEFPVVFLTGLEDGVFPHMRSLGDQPELEEERRLAYVGLTRAQQRLYVTRSVVRSAWGAPSHNPASRFLDELPVDLVDWRRTAAEQTSWSRPVLPSLPQRNAGSPSRRFGTAAARADADAKAQRRDVPSLAPGDRVLHDSFGMGSVVALDGVGDKAVASVDFGSQGVKRLLLRYAPVEKL